MFKKGPDIDKKKLLAKASDVKLDSLTRLKHFNTIIAHSDLNETHSLFKTHFTFIYDTFIETFSTFDYNSKQRRDDLECILFIFEKIIIYKPELIKNDLLQVFVLNSSNAFLTKVENITMLDEQFKMCKRIMNIYRYMVMKIYLNKSTWKQLLEVMLMITEQLFPVVPPERRESTIGGRIAPAFFQTFIVSWIRANLYVHISSQMWYKFYDIMRDLVGWRELVEEWSTLMGSLTRVLVKHVYGLSLTDLPLDRPQGGRRRPKALKSFSTTDGGPASATDHNSPSSSNSLSTSSRRSPIQTQRPPRSGSVRLPNFTQRGQTSGLTRSNSDGLMFHQLKLYYSSSMSANNQSSTPDKMRKIKSEYLILTSELGLPSCVPSDPGIDGISLKDSMILEQDQNDSHHSGKSSMDSSFMSHKSTGKRSESRSSSDKCVLLGGSIRGWTSENSVIMWRRMLGLFGNINQIEDPEIHLIAMKCLAVILNDFMKTRDNLGISLDNQSTPEQPSLIPPYTFLFGWLLEATHLPDQFSKSRSIAYSLLCTVIIRRHDIELSQQYYITFYEAIQRGLSLPDISVHAAIIQNSTQLLSLELPGCTFLVQGLYERSRSLLLSSGVGQRTPDKNEARSKDQAVQILNAILSLNRPIKKLMVLKSEVANNSMNLVAPGDIKAKVFDTLLAYNNRPIILDSHTRSRSLCSLAIHVYHELCDKNDGPDVDKLFDTIMTVLQDASNSILFRINCDLLRLFVDHATTLTRSRPDLVSSMIRTVCQLVVRLGADENHKESIQYLLMCLEDWCMAVSKSFLLKPMEQPAFVQREDNLSIWPSDSLLTIVLRSLESVVHGEQYLDDASNRGIRNSVNLSKNLDTQVSGRQTQAKGAPSPSGSHRTLVNNEQHTNRMHQQSQDANLGSPIGNSKNLEAIKLACKVSHLKLNTYLGHYPFKQIGPASMSCCVNELDHLTANDQEASDLKNLSGVLMLVIDGNTLISFIGATRNSDGLCQPIHLIIRNLCGKYSWDASCIESSVYKQPIIVDSSEKSSTMFDSDSYQEAASRSSAKYDSDFNDDGHSTSSYSSRASLGRDCIGDLLNQLTCSIASANGHSMSSPSQNMQRSKRNSAQSISNPRFKIAQAEETMIALLTNQRFQELNHCEKSDDTDRKNMAKTNAILGMGGDKLTEQFNPSANSSRIVSFEQCRQLIQQLGYLTWEKRCKIDSLTKSPRLMRELKNLDAQPGRETHKIAVIYVANGQEDKNSILANSNGSRAFEEFVAGLGWEVNLASHLGFKGGLQANKSTGETAPYYCTATTEVMFHVSTKIPVNKPVDDESLKRKLCHLGNDEIHIVWSEHVRDYRRGIIPTEFGDVIIAIYPMLTFQGYYRVQITSNQDVPQFGPLFDNCIVHQTSLAPLVRATAINASRAKRLRLPYFLAHYEERSRLIESIVQNHREKQSFEEFASQLYANSELNCSQHQQQQQGLTSQDHQCCT